MFYLEVTNSIRLLKKICINQHANVIIHQPNVLFRSLNKRGARCPPRSPSGKSMVLICRVLSVWWVALAVGWAAAAVAGPAKDLLDRRVIRWRCGCGAGAARQRGRGQCQERAMARPPLIVASGNGHLDVVQALLAKGAEVNAKDERRRDRAVRGLRVRPPRCCAGAARQRGRRQCQGRQRRDRADVGLPNGHLDVVQALLAKGADVNAKATDGATALMAPRWGTTTRSCSFDRPDPPPRRSP